MKRLYKDKTAKQKINAILMIAILMFSVLLVFVPTLPAAIVLSEGFEGAWAGDWDFTTAGDGVISNETTIVHGGLNSLNITTTAGTGAATITEDTGLKLNVNNTTVSFWVYLNASTHTGKDWYVFYMQNETNNRVGVRINETGNWFIFEKDKDNVNSDHNSTITAVVSNHSWMHITLCVNATHFQLYNGTTLILNSTHNQAVGVNYTSIQFGDSSTGATSGGDYFIDDVQMKDEFDPPEAPIYPVTDVGYEYGNWTHSEHFRDDTFDELWIESNNESWYPVDISGIWDWGFNTTFCYNDSATNDSANIGWAIMNTSANNRSQFLTWAYYNSTDLLSDNKIFLGHIYAARSSADWDCVLYGANEVFLLTYNGTGFQNTNDSTPATNSSTAYNYWTINWGWLDGEYYYEGMPWEDRGSWIKTIYNQFCTSLYSKMWGDNTVPAGLMDEPAGWCVENITGSGSTSGQAHGVVCWNPDDLNYSAYFDIIELWQLNSTVNTSADFYPDDNGTYGRPRMNFPVYDMDDFVEGLNYFFNETVEGNITIDTVTDFMRDNVTNPMNLESRMYHPDSTNATDQNDTIYYYSAALTNYSHFNESAYNNWLFLWIQDCYDGSLDAGDTVCVAIDVDNNGIWEDNDRLYAYAPVPDLQWEYHGVNLTLEENAEMFGYNATDLEKLHRYNTHTQYQIFIPLDDLIKNDTNPLDVGDVAGLSIFTYDGEDSNVPFWQNWNETNCSAFHDEKHDNCKGYFLNTTLVGGNFMNITESNIGRWGELYIGPGALFPDDANTTPTYSSENPTNETMYVVTTLGQVSVAINDAEGDLFNYSIHLYSTTVADDKGYSNATGQSNGTKTFDFTGSLQPGQNYTWWVNSTDAGTGEWNNESFWFVLNNTYAWTINKTGNITTVSPTNASHGVNVNYTINITNSGTGTITGIIVNESFFNCSCSDWNMTLVDTDIDMSNITFYNDSCYMLINVTNLTGGSSTEFYLVINITECAANTTGTLRNYANATGTYVTGSDYHDIAWGALTTQLRITYTTMPAGFTNIWSAVVIMLFVLVIIITAAIMIRKVKGNNPRT